MICYLYCAGKKREGDDTDGRVLGGRDEERKPGGEQG